MVKLSLILKPGISIKKTQISTDFDIDKNYEKHFMCTILLPYSKYSSRVINMLSKVDTADNTLAPFQTESMPCLFSWIRMVLDVFGVTRALSSVIILSCIPGISELPPKTKIMNSKMNGSF